MSIGTNTDRNIKININKKNAYTHINVCASSKWSEDYLVLWEWWIQLEGARFLPWLAFDISVNEWKSSPLVSTLIFSHCCFF